MKPNKTNVSRSTQKLLFIVDLDERGWFKAHVEDESGKCVFEFSNEDEYTGWPRYGRELWIVEDGFMLHERDIDGLLSYLREMGLVNKRSTLTIP